MARPKKNNADYFSHDSGMRNDEKIKAVRRKFGLTGYAVWCMLLEKITDSNNFELYIESEITYELIAGDFEINSDKLKNIIDYLLLLGLLKKGENILYSQSLKDRLSGVIEKRERERLKSQSRSRKTDGKFEAKNQTKTSSQGITATETPQSKVKESKVKESKVNNNIINSIGNEISEEISPKKNKTTFKDLLKNNFHEEFINKLKDKYQISSEDLKTQTELFIIHWTEKNENGKKEKWEMEKTYDIQRRMYKWLANNNNWNKGRNRITNTIPDGQSF